VGAFTPRTRFRSIIYDGTVYPEVQRRALADLERHIVDHEAAPLVLAAAERLVEGGFAKGWGGCGLDAPRSRAASRPRQVPPCRGSRV
jgi:hypothetical protein